MTFFATGYGQAGWEGWGPTLLFWLKPSRTDVRRPLTYQNVPVLSTVESVGFGPAFMPSAHGSPYDPNLHTDFSDLSVFTRAEIDGMLPLYTFGKLEGKAEAARHAVDAARHGRDQAGNEIRRDVQRLYSGLLLAREVRGLIDDVLEKVGEARMKVQGGSAQGTGQFMPIDQYRLEVFSSEVEARRVAVDSSATVLLATLKVAVGLPRSAHFDIADSALEISPRTAVDVDSAAQPALQRRPELAQLRDGEAARTALVCSARADLYPQFYAGALLRYGVAPNRTIQRNPFIRDDYPIHLLFRIREEVQRGVGIREATYCAVRSSAAPLTLCALTNLAAFISLIWMQFRGFSQFGIIAGTGVMLVLLATALTVPGMVWILRKWVTKAKAEVRGSNRGPLAAPGRVQRLGWHVAVAFVVIWGVLAGASAWIVHKRLGFEEDFEHLRPHFAELHELRSKAETIEGFQKSSPAVFFTSDFEASREIARVVQARMDQEGNNSPIGRVLSLGSILDGDSPSKRSGWERILKLLDDPVLRSAPPGIWNKVHELRSRLDLSPLTLESIPPSVRRSLTRKVEGNDGTSGDLFLVVVEPKKRVALAPEAMAFAARLEEIAVNNRRFVPAGEALIFADILQLVRSEGWVILLLASLATAALVYLAFRSWVDLTVRLVTLAGSLAMSLAILALLGMPLNFFNITVLPLLVGLGINYGIHLLHRYRAEGTAATLAARNLAGAMGSAAATTVVGFAGLLLAGHPGLWSMGFTAAVGIGVIALSCLFFLPAFTDLVEQLSGKRKTAVSPES